MTVGELGERMDADEQAEWMAFDRVHTSDAWRRNAALRLTIHRAMGDTKTGLDNLLPPADRPRPKQDPFEALRVYAKAHNARLGVK